ncbi:MAG: ASPIC/UnbV domain-containing protein, partial [bacterium]
LKNSSVRQGNWLGIALKPSGAFMAPACTKIKINSGGKIQHAWVSPGTSYLSSSDPRLVFGLDPMVNEATVEVSFPAEKGKPARTISNIVKELNRYIDITK